MRKFPQLSFFLLVALLLASCGPEDMIWPSDRIGPMRVNRYGHSNSQSIWEFCDESMPAEPGTKEVECTIPWADELWIGTGVCAESEALRDTLWEVRTWELYIDGFAVDLPAFNIADYDSEVDGKLYEFRDWRIRLCKILEGEHTLHNVMHVNREVEKDQRVQVAGTYELVVSFTFQEK